MIAPLLVSVLPSSIGDPIGMLLRSNAGTAMSGIESTAELLSAGWGLAVLFGGDRHLAAAAVSLRRRDA